MQSTAQSPATAVGDRRLFWACFFALTATSFAFMLRIMILKDLALEFGLSETEKGEILGVGIWPFAVSIVLFSLVIDRIGYGKAIIFAFLGHTAFAFLTIFATGYWTLYIGSFLGGLAAGAIEAAINPIVATIFPKEKTKWLNILHAGWPGGAVLAGLLVIFSGEYLQWEGEEYLKWQGKVGLIFIPVITYGVMMATCRFPVNERVAAGVPYRTMLQEVGFVGALITLTLVMVEVGRVLNFPAWVTWGVIGVLTVGFGFYTASAGRPMFIILILTMIPLAITELGTDSWITDLMEPEMVALEWHPAWVLVYTMAIMLVLRFMAGPIVHRLSPLGLLAVSAFLAICGLTFLSMATGLTIFLAATIYGLGKTFFWPTMLGVVSERFPRGGALTLNLISGIGMLAAGVLGGALLGNIQDKEINRQLLATDPALHQQLVGQEKISIFGRYHPLDAAKVKAASEDDRKVVNDIKQGAKKGALTTVALFPGLMLLSYIALLLYFRAKGGYKPVDLAADVAAPSAEY